VWLARSSLKPLPCAGSAMRTAGPTTGAAFTRLEILDRALDSVAACSSLFGRDDPTNPFVPRQRRQILPGRQRRRFRGEGLGEIRRGFVYRSGFSLALHRQSLPQQQIGGLSDRSRIPASYDWGSFARARPSRFRCSEALVSRVQGYPPKGSLASGYQTGYQALSSEMTRPAPPG
jgi:hypothetical protein